LKPEFSPDVDCWLRNFFGKHAFEKACKWIAWSLAFEEGPICAMSVVGHPGCGKKMLVQGLAECVNTEEFADSTEFGNFQHNLGRSPFIVVNEGFSDRNNMPDIADRFRSFISGDPIKLNEKYKAPITVRSPIRILLTANNRDVVYSLIQHRDLEPQDREAIAQRIYHIDLPISSSEYLSRLGNYQHTKGWIKGDAGARSDYTIAKHFLHLYENRGVRDNGRFLVQGEINSEIIESMALNAGCAPQIIECLMGLIKSLDTIESGNKYRDGFVISVDNKIFVTPYAIVQYYRDRVQKYAQTRLNAKQVVGALKGLRSKEQFNHPTRIVLDKGSKSTKMRWTMIDPILLQASASHFGILSERLDGICEKKCSAKERLKLMMERGNFE